MSDNPTLEMQGTWPKDSPMRAFVDGCAWWQFHQEGSTLFNSERREAEVEAIRRYSYTLVQSPAPRISEEEIQLLTGKLYIGLVNEPIYTWHEKCATILRTLNESRKA